MWVEGSRGVRGAHGRAGEADLSHEGPLARQAGGALPWLSLLKSLVASAVVPAAVLQHMLVSSAAQLEFSALPSPLSFPLPFPPLYFARGTGISFQATRGPEWTPEVPQCRKHFEPADGGDSRFNGEGLVSSPAYACRALRDERVARCPSYRSARDTTCSSRMRMTRGRRRALSPWAASESASSPCAGGGCGRDPLPSLPRRPRRVGWRDKSSILRSARGLLPS